MKTTTNLPAHVSHFTRRALTFLTLLWTAGIAHAQLTITLGGEVGNFAVHSPAARPMLGGRSFL